MATLISTQRNTFSNNLSYPSCHLHHYHQQYFLLKIVFLSLLVCSSSGSILRSSYSNYLDQRPSSSSSSLWSEDGIPFPHSFHSSARQYREEFMNRLRKQSNSINSSSSAFSNPLTRSQQHLLSNVRTTSSTDGLHGYVITQFYDDASCGGTLTATMGTLTNYCFSSTSLATTTSISSYKYVFTEGE